MTKPEYRSSTGLYSMRLGSDIIHEGITVAEVTDLLSYYKKRWADDSITWPFDPENITIEEFSGTYVLKSKR